MRRLRIAPLLVATLLSPAGAALAQVGVTSATTGDPLGQPPTLQERVLRVGIDVVANERVTTKADDRAHLVFLDGTSLTVGPNSALVIDKFVYDPNVKKGEIGLKTAKGVFRLVGGNISKTNEITVTTPSATIGIRGGIATVVVAENGHTTATFLYGTSMTVTGQGQTQTATRTGSQILTESGRAPAAPTIIPPRGEVAGATIERPASTTPAAPAAPVAPAIAPAVTPLVPLIQPVTSPAVPVVAPVTVAAIDQALDSSPLVQTNSKLPVQTLVALEGSRQGPRQRERAEARREGAGGGSAPRIGQVLRLSGVAQKGVAQQQSNLQQQKNDDNKKSKRR